MTFDAWSAFEAALVASPENTVDALRHSLRLLDDSPHEGTDAERAELRAAVLCELARVGGAAFRDALAAVEAARRLGPAGWASYYLAEAAVACGQYHVANAAVAAIPAGYFQSRDLNWRTVRAIELEALARAGLGEIAAVEQLVRRLAVELAAHGDDDDLASPVELVDMLIALGDVGRDALATLAAAIDVDEWFAPEIADRIRARLRG